MPLTALSTVVIGLTVGLSPVAFTAGSPPDRWRWPLDGTPVVARPFQPPPHPWSAGHRGVDLAAAPDATVVAAGAGVVSFAGYVAGVGVVSVIHAGGLRTTYEPVAPAVHAGLPVRPGDPLGRLLPGHGRCGPGRWCLHWGLLRGSLYLDPLSLLRHGPVRLLPWSGPLAPHPLAAVAPAPPRAKRPLVVAGATGHPSTGPQVARPVPPGRPVTLVVAAVAAAGSAATVVTAHTGPLVFRRLGRSRKRQMAMSVAARQGVAEVSRAGPRACP